jgi:predicted secreted acid phosphatase
VTTVGEERYGRDRAKEAAEATWMEAVRARFGTKWMDLRNSRGGTWECGRSSTGNRSSEKAQDMVGKFLEQCELKARPCRSELEQVNNKE